jgi:hypothetical protein
VKRIAFLLVLVACPSHYGQPLPPSHDTARVKFDAGPDELKKAHMATIASLKERAVGPMVVRGEKNALAAYVAGVAPGASVRNVVVAPLALDGSPRVQARVVAQAAPDTSALLVRRVEGGYLLAWTSLTDRGESLSIVGVDEDGLPRAAALELARTSDHVVWMEVVPTPRGALCVWAEEGPSGGANVLAQALDTSGKPRGVPSRVFRGATSWQAVPSGEGVALAIVAQNALSLVKLDDSGRVVGEPAPISKTVGADMDMVRAGKSLVFAWTDHSRIDPALVLAGVDERGKIKEPHDALPDAGSSTLAFIAGSDNGALIVWERSHKRERANRRVQLASIQDAGAPLESKTTLDLAGGAAIEAKSRGDGWGMIVSARACNVAADAGACGGVAPTFLRLDASLAVTQTEALVLGPPVSLAWSLDCGKDACLALAAGPDVPTNVYGVDLGDRASAHAAPVAKALPEDAPRLGSTITLASGAQVADVTAARVADTTLVTAIVSSGVDDKTHEDKNALRVTPFANGKAQAAVTISTKALATGGIAMVTSPSGKDAVIAYVAKEGAGSRVNVVRVDDKGARRGDAQLPGGRGDASDVSLVAVDDGFVLAWVDTRDGNGEVYAAKLRNDLSTATFARVTNAPGDATDTALERAGANVILAWADPRESPHDGFADIYAVALSPKDAKPLAKEGRVLSTAAHSRSPVLARTAQGVALAWIEEAPAGGASEEAKGAMFALLDDKAKATRDPIKLRLRDPGTVTAIALDSDPQSRLLHAVLARSSQDELSLDAARVPLDAGGQLDSYPLLALDGPSSLDVALALRADELIFSDDGPDATDARVRRGVILWKK